MDWFLYDNGLRHERVKQVPPKDERELDFVIVKLCNLAG